MLIARLRAFLGAKYDQEKSRRAAKPPLVWRPGSAVLRTSLPNEADGAGSCRLCRQAGDRGGQHLERLGPLPCSFSEPGSGHQARRAGTGGFPVEIPAMALPENFVKPTTMLYRNFLAMEVEESLRSLPIDGAVLMGGCDKTTPALVMGAISAGLPAIFMPAGPMLRGNWRGKILGSGSDIWKYWDEKRAGNISEDEWGEMEAGIARSDGVCMTMGTAMTMTSLTEVLGLALPGSSSIPAPDANHARMAADCGRRIVEMVWEDLKPSDILTAASFDNAIVTSAALAGSTNAIIHLIAMARRAGIPLELERFDEFSAPVLANVRPSGKYLMEDFYYAGGL